jgi:hypothetical protein
MKQVWNDLLKVYDNVPETMAEYNASQPQRAPSVSELPPMPAPVDGTQLPPSVPPPSNFSVGMFDPLAGVAKDVMGSPYAGAAASTANEVVKFGVSPFVNLPLAAAEMVTGGGVTGSSAQAAADIKAQSSPMGGPTPTGETVPPPSDPNAQPTGANQRFSGAGAGTPPMPATPVEVKTGSSETTQGSRTDWGPTDELDKANESMRKIAEDARALRQSVNDDPEVIKYMNKQFLAGKRLESLMDPTSDEFKQFSTQVAQARSKIDSANKDLIDFQERAKVDPERYWKATPLLQHALNSVSMLMEGKKEAAFIRAGLPAPTGLVQARIDKAINDDIARQKDELKMGEAAKGNTVNRYRDNLKMLGDARTAEIKTRLDYQSMVKNTLETYMQKSQGKFDDLKMRELIAAQDIANAKAKLEMNKAVISSTRQDNTAYITPGQLTPDQQKRQDEIRTRTFNVGRVPLVAYNETSANALRTQAAATTNAIGYLDKLIEYRNSMGPEGYLKWISGGTAEANNLVISLQMALKKANGLGAMDAGTQKILSEQIPDVTAFGQVADKYAANRKSLLTQLTADINASVPPESMVSAERLNKGITQFNIDSGITASLK